MADSRIKDLAQEISVNDLASLLETLYLAGDASSFSEAKKVLFKSFLSNAKVEANTIVHQAITPKAFYDSIMSETVMGINRLATALEIVAKSGSGLITSANLASILTMFISDIFVTNGNAPKSLVKTADTIAASGALAYQTVWSSNGAVSANTTVSLVPPELYECGKGIKGIYFSYLVNVAGTPLAGTNYIAAPGADGETDLSIGYNVAFYLYDRGRDFGIQTFASKSYMDVAVTVNAVLQTL